jgi:hypothetical protein
MRSLIVLSVLLWTTSAYAADEQVPAYSPDPPIQTIPPGDDKIVVVYKGKPVPFSGQLFSPATALRWANWLTQYRTRLVQDVEREREVCRIEVDHQIELRDIEAERNRKVEKILTDQVKKGDQRNVDLQHKMNNPSFFRSMEFGLLLGAGTVAIGAVAIGVAAN